MLQNHRVKNIGDEFTYSPTSVAMENVERVRVHLREPKQVYAHLRNRDDDANRAHFN
jgi:hypothetical protein